MSELRDLSQLKWSPVFGGFYDQEKRGSRIDTEYISPETVFKEAIRAQASEDALKERVRVLEDLLANIVDYSKGGADSYKKRVRYEEMVIALTGGKESTK